MHCGLGKLIRSGDVAAGESVGKVTLHRFVIEILIRVNFFQFNCGHTTIMVLGQSANTTAIGTDIWGPVA